MIIATEDSVSLHASNNPGKNDVRVWVQFSVSIYSTKLGRSVAGNIVVLLWTQEW